MWGRGVVADEDAPFMQKWEDGAINVFRGKISSRFKVLVRQFDSVGVLLITLVLFRQNFFKPLGLLFRDPLVYRFWVVADEELLAAMVTPQDSHLLKADRFLAATFSYRNCSHGLISAANDMENVFGPVINGKPPVWRRA